MDVYILDDTLATIGVIDEYQSFIWTERYYEAGDCEIYVPATMENLQLLQQGNFITKGRGGALCRIDKVEVKSNPNNGIWLLVKGTDSIAILNQRVDIAQTSVAENASQRISELFLVNIIYPSQNNRAISIFNPYTDIEEIGYSYRNPPNFDYVFDCILDICRQYECGNGCRWDVFNNARKIQLYTYFGTDRSLSQSVNDPLVFADYMENIADTDYIEDYTSFKNAAYISGEGQGTQRTLVQINNGSGLDRFELYVDAGSQSKNVTGGTLTTSQYEAMLQSFGNDALAKAGVVTTFSGTIESRLYEYGTDYHLGDIVTLQNPLGVSVDVRITQVIESDDTQNGHVFVPSYEFIRFTT